MVVVVTAGTAVAFTTGTVTTFTAGTVATLAARAAFATGSALTLYIAFGLGLKRTHRETVFTGLLVDLDEFHFDCITLVETGSLHVFEAVP